ncbi:type II toxin-antitoxin system TacA family antitoxin [Pseudoduganella namucuonensis]|uniref:Uncharacterized conserved protein, DUF1778 family n=1 Tax=Pseudoduganella namucuonensis TaxID=1035707 RepID=A0A1I7L7P7_9BURK|nr:DUF1778 domain-containing protein [Pseudoduganella namucuonensis]SFV05648.1 Uncharacterized conserved protein, DUF1778 family [Pseudoduganella namucuonensis]
MNAPVERERITARISSAVAETLNSAAELTGTTLNNFVVQAALEKAQKIVDRENFIQLSRNDAAMLLDLLDAPPKPNAARRRAYERFMREKYGVETGSA